LCAVALAVSGVRTAVVTLVVTVCVAVLVRLRPRPVVIAGLIAVLVAAYAALWVVPAEDLGRDGTQGSLRRIVLGVRNPFDREASTLIEHVDLVVDGFENVPSKPFGRGTSATNLAGERIGGGGFDTEYDVSNGAAAFGFPGIVLTAAIVLWGLVLAVSRAWRRRDLLCLAALGFVLVPFRFWFNGGHY